jgi:hypothetical protein
MQAAAARDRIYVLTLVLTLVAICAFGVFVIRDYQDQGSQKVGLARTTSGGDSSLPSTGDTGSAAAQGTTGTSGTSAGSSGSAGGTSAGASAGTSAGS